MAKGKQYILPLIATFILIVYVILDLVFDRKLWEASLNLTQHMQDNQFPGEEIMFEIFTYIVFLPPLIAFIAFITMDCKLNVILYMVLIAASVTANEILKNLYHQPRPYMTTDQIKAYKCNGDFGKPSGHAQNSVVLVLLMPYLIFPKLYKLGRIQDSIQKNQKKTGYTIESLERLNDQDDAEYYEKQSLAKILLKLFIIILLIFSLFMTGLSRVYLGVHSLGQVILGWVYGLYIVVIYITVIHKILRKFLFSLIKERHKNSALYHYFVPFLWLMLLLLIILIVVLLELNIYVFNTEIDINTWIESIENCKEVPLGTLTQKSPSVLYNSVFDATFFGAIITSLGTGAYFIKGSYQEGQFYEEFVKQEPKLIVKRIMVLLLLCLLALPFLFIQSNDVYIQGFFQILPVCLILGGVITYLFPLVCHKLDIQVRGDIFYLKTSGQTVIQEPSEEQVSMEAHQVY